MSQDVLVSEMGDEKHFSCKPAGRVVCECVCACVCERVCECEQLQKN